MLRHNSIYATFPNVHDAERAAGALLDHGVRATAISFIIPGGLERAPIVAGTPHMLGSVHNNGVFDTSNAPTPDFGPASTVNGGAIDLNTGQRIGEDASVTQGNGYRYDALGAVIPDRQPSVPVTYVPHQNPADPIPINTPLRGSPDVVSSNVLAIARDAPLEAVESDHMHIIDMHRTEPGAAVGISTTTAGDAGKGALEGAGIGIGLGTLLGIAAVLVPGIGWVAGAGAIVAGLAAATGAAGAVAGGVYGYLADMGLPPDQTHHLQTHLEEGGPLLSVSMVDGLTDNQVLEILQKYGATSAQAY